MGRTVQDQGRERAMKWHLGAFAIAAPMLVAPAMTGPALAQKAGGLLKMFSPDSPASMSILEESTVFAEGSMQPKQASHANF